MSAFDTIPGKATADIEPCRFVRYTGAYQFTQASAATHRDVVGVSGEDSKDPPQTGSDTAHAEAGDSVHVHQAGRIARIDASAAFAAGARLTSDADGKAATAASGNQVYALALEPAAAEDERPKCLILPPTPEP